MMVSTVESAMRPLYSIVIPTRNRGNLLGGAIRSALAQTMPGFELLVLDNASTDGTAGVLGRYRDPRIRTVRAPQPLLMHDSWSLAMRHAAGDFILYLCDDDALHPRCLECLDPILRRTGAEAACWRLCYFEQGGADDHAATFRFGAHTDAVWAIDGPGLIDAAFEMRITNNDVVPRLLNGAVSRELVERAAAAETPLFRPSCPDYTAMIAMMLHARRAVFIDAPLGVGGITPASIGASGMVRGEAARRFIEELIAREPSLAVPAGGVGALLTPRCWYAQTYLQCAREFPALRGREPDWAHMLGLAGLEIAQWRSEGAEVGELARRFERLLDGPYAAHAAPARAFIDQRRVIETEQFLLPPPDPGSVFGLGPFIAPGGDARELGCDSIDAFAAVVDQRLARSARTIVSIWQSLAAIAGRRDVVVFGLGHFGRTICRVPPEGCCSAPGGGPGARAHLVYDDGADQTPAGWQRIARFADLDARRHAVLVTPLRFDAIARRLEARGFRRGHDWMPLKDLTTAGSLEPEGTAPVKPLPRPSAAGRR
jgi:hypothetical protein